MKALVFALMTLIAAPVFAVTPLEPDYIAGQIINVEPLCPANVMCITDGTVLTVRYTLPSGCYNLSPVSWSATEGQVVLTASQTGSEDLICIQALIEVDEKVSLVNIFPPFVVQYYGTDVAEEVK